MSAAEVLKIPYCGAKANLTEKTEGACFNSLDKYVVEKHVLAESLQNGQMEVYYQPKHHAVTGELIGAEALARWNHPTMGLLQPQFFLPLFEKNGLISPLDTFVWENVCKDLRDWIDDGVPVIPISVNTSRQDYLGGDLWNHWGAYVEKHNIPAELLHIEVAETIISDIEEKLLEQLSECRTAGIRIEIDDFGIGYSSLSRLSLFPFDIIKLDKLFLDNLFSEKGTCIVKSCISMAKGLNMEVVAEGVETGDQINRLKAMACDIVQGYFYSQAMPKNEFENYLQSNLHKTCE